MKQHTLYLALCMFVAVCREAAPLKPGQAWNYIDPEVAPPALEDGEGEALRPGFHITAQNGWMNDPNGMFEHLNVTHVMYQWNPAANIWGSPYWGHVISSDLVHWMRLPPALVPDQSYDFDGVFSGSASFQADGTPILLYTGVSNFSQLGYYYQVQASATPANSSDPQLARWIKSTNNPLNFQLPAGGTHAQFRDPTTTILQNGRYWTAVGAQDDCVGTAELYSTTDYVNWTLDGSLLSQIGLDQNNGSCPAPATLTAGNENCDQMGTMCRTWECPDIYEVDDVYVFKYSDQVNTRNPYSADWYVLSNTDPTYIDATTNNATAVGLDGIFQEDITCESCGSPSTPRMIDYGGIYASKSWEASDGRRLWMGWSFETATGCYQQCSTGTPFTATLGWQGAQTVPREVTFDAASGSLLFNPVEEVAQLRLDSLFNGTVPIVSTVYPPTNASVIVEPGNNTQMELLAYFNLTAAANATSSNFVIGSILSTGVNSSTIVFINGTLVGGNVTTASVFVDNSQSGGATNTSLELGGPVILPPNGVPATNLQLHMLIDRSMLEVFALGGRGRVTSRIYPAGMLEPMWGLEVLAGVSAGGQATASADVWELSTCWVSNIEPSTAPAPAPSVAAGA